MTFSTRFLLSILFIGSALFLQSQIASQQISAEKEKMYTPFMYARLGGPEGVSEYKQKHPEDYHKLLWYYSESFYIKRNRYQEGETMNEAIIDITRFESHRKENEEAEVQLKGYKDVLVLLPTSKLIYKPAK